MITTDAKNLNRNKRGQLRDSAETNSAPHPGLKIDHTKRRLDEQSREHVAKVMFEAIAPIFDLTSTNAGDRFRTFKAFLADDYALVSEAIRISRRIVRGWERPRPKLLPLSLTRKSFLKASSMRVLQNTMARAIVDIGASLEVLWVLSQDDEDICELLTHLLRDHTGASFASVGLMEAE